METISLRRLKATACSFESLPASAGRARAEYIGAVAAAPYFSGTARVWGAAQRSATRRRRESAIH